MQVFVVGGAVRDMLLGLEPKDLDFVVVGSTPEEMIAKGFEQVGADFPVFLDDQGREFALARTERKSGSGHRGFETEFDPTVTLEDDLVRRDLTINALAVPAEDWDDFLEFGDAIFVIDHVGGIQDLKRRSLRHVSEAFREDPLRVLRVARFAARMNFKVAEETSELMKEMVESGELNELTPERVWKEMSRAMMEPFPQHFFSLLRQVNALEVVAGEAQIAFCGLQSTLTPLAHLRASELERWMCVFFDTDEQAVEDFIAMHKLPTEVAKAIRFGLHMFSAFFNGSQDVLGACKRFQVWHDLALLREFAGMVRIVEPAHSSRFDAMVEAIEAASNVSFDNLSEEEREGLKGAEIGEAIASKRMEVIVKWENAA